MADDLAEAVRPTLRHRLFLALDPRAHRRGLSRLNLTIAGLILVSTAMAVIETEPLLSAGLGRVLTAAEFIVGLMFSAEYLARLWSAPEARPDRPAWRARLAFVLSLTGLADLVAIIASFATSGSSALLFRLVRLARIFRLAKLGRMSRALDHLVDAVISRRDELWLSLGAGLVLILIAATALYLAEGSVQPDKFGSIPRALWWAVAATTTIGYGDAYPVTPVGKTLASVIAIVSIGIIAMPTGILAAAFSDAMQRHRQGNSHSENSPGERSTDISTEVRNEVVNSTG